VYSDSIGVSGEAIIIAARLVGAPAFKAALTGTGASLGIIASQFVYDTAIRPGYEGIDPARFALVEVNAKESSFPAWMDAVSGQTREHGHDRGTQSETEETAQRWLSTPRHRPGGELFTAEAGTEPVSGEQVGYRSPTACATAGITRRQLDYWAHTGLVEPSVRSGRNREQPLYSFRDILVLKVIKRLLDTGISLQQIRAAVQHLRDRGGAGLAQVTLMSDGISVYECTSADEVVDLLQGGQGIYGIALGRVWREVEGDLALLPNARSQAAETAAPPGEEHVSRSHKTG
jgi:DNA-binding transcriptional MerR regulator